MKRMLSAVERKWKGLLVEIDDGEQTAVGRLESFEWSFDEKTYNEGDMRVLATLTPLYEEDLSEFENDGEGHIKVRFNVFTMKVREVKENGSYK